MDELYNKCLEYDFEELFERKGYSYFSRGIYNMNIIGVRSNNDNVVTNKYDDYLVLIWNTPTGQTRRHVYTITTEPGLYYMTKSLLNPKGTAILVPGQYKGCYQLGMHQGKYKAMCQKKPVRVYRDNNRDEIYDMNPDKIDSGMFGINIHRSDELKIAISVNKYSAGCQVFQDPVQFASFIRICEKQLRYYPNSFTYTLILEQDMV